MNNKRERFWCQASSGTSETPLIDEEFQGSSQDITKAVHDHLHRRMVAAGLISRDENISSSSVLFGISKSSDGDTKEEFNCADRLITLLSSWGSFESLERDIIEEFDYNEKEDLEGFELRPVYEAFRLNAIEKPWKEKLYSPFITDAENESLASFSQSPSICTERTSQISLQEEETPGNSSDSLSDMPCKQHKYIDRDSICGRGVFNVEQSSGDTLDNVKSSPFLVKESSKMCANEELVTSPCSGQGKVILKPRAIQLKPQFIRFGISLSSLHPPACYVYDCEQSPEQLICSFANILYYLLNATYVKVYIHDDFNLLLKESILFHVLNRDPIGWNVEEKNCFATEAVRRQMTMVFPDVTQVNEDYPQGLGIPVDNVNSLLCIPAQNPFLSSYGLIELGCLDPHKWSTLEINFVTILIKWLTLSHKHSQNNLCLYPLWQIDYYVKSLVDQYYLDENLPRSIQACCNFVKHLTRSEQASFIVILNGHIAVFYRHCRIDGNRYVKKDVRVLGKILGEDKTSEPVHSNNPSKDNADDHNTNKSCEHVNNSQRSENKDDKESKESQNQDSKSLHQMLIEDLNTKLSETLNSMDTDATYCQLTNEEDVHTVCDHVKDEDIVQYICRTKQRVVINDTKQCEEDFLKPLSENPDADPLAIHSLLCIPIVSSSKSVLGILNVFNKTSTGFKPKDQSLVEIVASYFTLILGHQLLKHDLVRLRTEYELVYGILENIPTKEKIACDYSYSFNIQNSQENIKEDPCVKPKRRFWDLDAKGQEKSHEDIRKSLPDAIHQGSEYDWSFKNKNRREAEKNVNQQLEEEADNFWENFEDDVRPEFFTYSWYPNASEETLLPSYIYFMLTKVFGGSQLFQREAVQDFIRLVAEFYHRNRFHNFLQGVLCMHFIYVTIKNNIQVWAGLDKIALLLSGLCQYISHPGFTIRDSTMEIHHYKVTKMLVAKSGLFSNDPQIAKVIIEKIRTLMLSIQHPTNAENVHNISTVLASTGFDWAQAKHREWIHILLINTSRLNMLCKPFPECWKHLVDYLQDTERPSKQCADFVAVLKEFDDDGKALIQFYILSSVVPWDDYLLFLVYDNLSLLFENQQK
ncbi:hypothetical protein WDU94_011485 [Cyamophila willieti]